MCNVPRRDVLVRSAVGQFGAHNFGAAAIEKVHGAIAPVLRAAVAGLRVSGEKRISLILECGEGQGDAHLTVFCEPLPPPPTLAQVEVQRLQRANPSVKSAQWVLDRRDAELGMQAGSNEVVIADETGRLYEGLSSNFAVIDAQGRLLTAPNEAVLSGTIMELAKAAAAEIGLPVEHTFPRLQDLKGYQAAFITSTSRLLLPISRVCLGDSPPIPLNSLEHPALVQLQNRVRELVVERASE